MVNNKNGADMNTIERFKNKLEKGETVYGPFVKSTDPALVECAGYAGFDFVILDMEHGPAGFSELQNLIRGAEVSGIIPIVRTSDSSEISISRALDLGAKGVQVPQIHSVSEAGQVIRAAKFYPQGQRGVCRFVRAAAYSALPRKDYFRQANEALVILQVEGSQVLDELDELLQVDGLDILFIGPYDLSQSLGVPGEITHPRVMETIEAITRKAGNAGVTTGVFCDTIESALLWRNAGIQYISYSVDLGLYTEICSSLIRTLKK
jgi:4-hydroxy-2-oxoheptanedioate aldolase